MPSTGGVDYPPMEYSAVHSLIASVVLTTVATSFMAIRFYTRGQVLGILESSDWVALVALFPSVVFMAILIAETKFGMGWHEVDLSPNTLTKQLKLFWLSIPFYNAALVLAKASIVIQHSRVIPTKKIRVFCWVIMGFIGIYGIWAVLCAFLNCIPVAKFWNTALPGHCLPEEMLWFTNAGLHMFTDLMIIIISILASAAMNLPLRQQISLSIILALGGLTCIISVLRLHSVRILSNSNDFTYDTSGFSMWSAIECNTGIICACLPSFRPLICRIWPSFIPTLNDTGSSPSHYPIPMRPTSQDIICSSKRAPPSHGGGGRHHLEQSKTMGIARQDENFCKLKKFPIPGNAFAEDLHRKGSFFEEQRQSHRS